MALMVGLGVLGIALLVGAPWLSRLVVGRGGDPGGVTRMVQILAVVLLVIALLVRPHQDETAAFPPPPDAPGGR